MQSAAGGTSQRLKPALAMVCSRSRIPSRAPDTLPVLLIVVIDLSPLQPPLPGRSATTIPLSPEHRSEPAPTLLLRTIQDALGSLSASENYQPPTRQDMADAVAGLNPKMCPPPTTCALPQTRLDLRSPAENVDWDRTRDGCR